MTLPSHFLSHVIVYIGVITKPRAGHFFGLYHRRLDKTPSQNFNTLVPNLEFMGEALLASTPQVHCRLTHLSKHGRSDMVKRAGKAKLDDKISVAVVNDP